MLCALILTALPLSPAALPQECVWEPIAPAEQPRVEAQSVVYDGKIYVFGGFFDAALNATPRTDVYDPATDTWTRLSDMLQTVTHHAIALDGDEVWVLGGFLGNNGGPVLNNAQRYHIPTDTWSNGPPMPIRRASGAAEVVGRKLHFFGGFRTRQLSAADHVVLDLDDIPSGWDTTTYPPLPTARGHLSSALLNGQIYAIGGQDGHDVNPIDLAVVDRYDPVSNTWHPVTPLSFPRSHVEASTYVYDGRIYVCGGRNNNPGGAPNLSSVSAYDPLLDAWIEQPPMPVAWLGPSLKPVDGKLYLTTGASNGNIPEAEGFRADADWGSLPQARYNVGGGDLALAQPWCSDGFFLGGETFVASGAPPIAGTQDDELYWSERIGLASVPDTFSYVIPVDSGAYRVVLHFAEIFWTQPGQRVFDVFLEGERILDDYDIVASVGPMAADVCVFDTPVTDGKIDLVFRSSVDRPKLSGIEISRHPDGVLDLYCLGAPNSLGVGARLFFLGSTSVSAGRMDLVLDRLPANKPLLIGVSSGQTAIPYWDGIMCLGGTVLPSPTFNTGPTGRLTVPVPLDMGIPIGPGFSFQAIYLDDAPGTINFTDAIRVHFTD